MNQLAAKLSIVAFACVFVAACSEGVPPIVSQAFASPIESEVAYFPTQFPAPEGAPAEHIEAF
ncbi:MAG TPA: hypothetical protein VLD36_02100 [Burkholderiales bacterium]|jgi:hypothetical protein|nr:hypothetical protein [Burkholderiales bacterium]